MSSFIVLPAPNGFFIKVQALCKICQIDRIVMGTDSVRKFRSLVDLHAIE